MFFGTKQQTIEIQLNHVQCITLLSGKKHNSVLLLRLSGMAYIPFSGPVWLASVRAGSQQTGPPILQYVLNGERELWRDSIET